MHDDAWQNDPGFEEYVINEVRTHRLNGHGGNFTVKYNHVWTFRFDSPHLIPRPGQTLRLFVDGLSVRGVVIDNQVIYYYPTRKDAEEGARRGHHP